MSFDHEKKTTAVRNKKKEKRPKNHLQSLEQQTKI